VPAARHEPTSVTYVHTLRFHIVGTDVVTLCSPKPYTSYKYKPYTVRQLKWWFY